MCKGLTYILVDLPVAMGPVSAFMLSHFLIALPGSAHTAAPSGRHVGAASLAAVPDIRRAISCPKSKYVLIHSRDEVGA